MPRGALVPAQIKNRGNVIDDVAIERRNQMACITLLPQPMAMATTQLTRVIRYENSAPWRSELNPERSLRMNWVVVTDSNGSRGLRMQWLAGDRS